jgi:hypothetical protein
MGSHDLPRTLTIIGVLTGGAVLLSACSTTWDEPPPPPPSETSGAQAPVPPPFRTPAIVDAGQASATSQPAPRDFRPARPPAIAQAPARPATLAPSPPSALGPVSLAPPAPPAPPAPRAPACAGAYAVVDAKSGRALARGRALRTADGLVRLDRNGRRLGPAPLATLERPVLFLPDCGCDLGPLASRDATTLACTPQGAPARARG